jgi:hypothetical protein
MRTKYRVCSKCLYTNAQRRNIAEANFAEETVEAQKDQYDQQRKGRLMNATGSRDV